MLLNHLIYAWRSLIRKKSQALINIAGLSLGLTAFVFILQYISTEKSVNKFHKNLPNLFRLINEDNKGNTWPEIEPGYALKAKARIAEVKEYCRFENGLAHGIIQNKEKNISFTEQNIGYVESNFFQFFSFPFVEGDPTSLNRSDVMFVSVSSAIKYFAKENPIGKSLTLSNQFGTKSFVIGGIYKDMSDNSDIQYDMVFSLEALNDPSVVKENDWVALDNLESQSINTFFLLNEHANYKQVEKKLIDLRNELDKDKDGITFRLQPMAEMHMATNTNDTYTHFAQLKYVTILGSIAFMILLIAWFNYINFSTATALQRAREVGVRKVIGASRSNLVNQFLSESFLGNAIAFILAIAFVSMLQPFFNELIGRRLSWKLLFNHPTWLYGLGLIILGSLLSGAYTAYVLANFNPVLTLKGKLLKGNSGSFLRKILVISQFSISIALIIGTLAIFSQLNYMRHKDLGFSKEQLMVIQGPQLNRDSTYQIRKDGFWNDLGQKSFVKESCTSGSIPGKGFNFATSGFTQPSSKPGDELISYSFAIISEKYLPTYKIPVVAGRNFTTQEANVEWNKNNKVILNQTAINKLGFHSPEEAIHTRIKWDERYLEIIGVVKDYNHSSVQREINPIIFYPQAFGSYYTLRLTPDKMQDKIASMEKTFHSFFPGNPFEYFFIDENFNKAYQGESQFASLFMTASLWAIFIACLGLFGLATFSIQNRIKEICIRKVLGASISSILGIVSKEFIILIIVALVIASPIAYFGIQAWLKDFAYRIEINWWLFAIAGFLVMTVALLTIGSRAIQAAWMNPVKSLRME